MKQNVFRLRKERLNKDCSLQLNFEVEKMNSGGIKVLIMAAGTGGHVFPAMSIAYRLMSKSVNVEWLGTPNGMENRLLNDTGIPLHHISVSGLRGTGLIRKMQAPIMLLRAFLQSVSVILKVRPNCVLGMGGFICGPAGIAAKILRKPLLIHEQNAVAGLTNRLLSLVADQVFEAYPNTFARSVNAIFTGNPLRSQIMKIKREFEDDSEPDIRVLVLGGSQGALKINSVIPELFYEFQGSENFQLLHQTGDKSFDETILKYKNLGIPLNQSCKVLPFIQKVSQAYAWADLVISRSGASTVSELAAVGLPSILIPYPHHSDNQQLLNARWLVDEKGAILIPQSDFNVQNLKDILLPLMKDRGSLREMAVNARRMGIRDAAEKIAALCIKAGHDD
tara:strand:+ start:7 stop:1185 length:1179 start_codon:yes stop_codon:yes gene_type:complete